MLAVSWCFSSINWSSFAGDPAHGAKAPARSLPQTTSYPPPNNIKTSSSQRCFDCHSTLSDASHIHQLVFLLFDPVRCQDRLSANEIDWSCCEFWRRFLKEWHHIYFLFPLSQSSAFFCFVVFLLVLLAHVLALVVKNLWNLYLAGSAQNVLPADYPEGGGEWSLAQPGGSYSSEQLSSLNSPTLITKINRQSCLLWIANQLTRVAGVEGHFWGGKWYWLFRRQWRLSWMALGQWLPASSFEPGCSSAVFSCWYRPR